MPELPERPSFIGTFGVAILALVGLAALFGVVAAARCSGDSTRRPASRALAPLPISRVRSVTYYEERPFTQYASHVIDALPRLKATGFNTVWLVLPWYEFEPRPLASPAAYDQPSFDALLNVLAALRAQRMHALIGLNYLGPGWSPQGIDACTWIKNPTMERAFESYVGGFLSRIDAYHDVPYILFFTETAQYCDPHAPDHGVALAAQLRRTLGSLPTRLPLELRAHYRFGYHDDTLISLGWAKGASPIPRPDPFDFLSMSVYGLERSNAGGIQTSLKAQIGRFRAFDHKAPLLFGEVGASRCNGGAANQARVETSVLSYAVGHRIGFNLWHWRPVANEESCRIAGFRALSLTKPDGVLNHAGRVVRDFLARSAPLASP